MKTQNQKYLDQVLAFAESNGLQYVIDNGGLRKDSFVPFVEIRHGILHLDYEQTMVSDLIHEFGHLALIPKQYRHLLHHNLFAGLKKFIDESFDSNCEHMIRIASSCEDGDVTAWSWAVGKKFNIPEHLIIEDHQYIGKGEDLRMILSIGQYFGISSLRHAKYTNKCHSMAHVDPDTIYPNMMHWTADQLLNSLKN